MTVDINIRLKDLNVDSKISEIKTKLESLNDKDGSLDLGDGIDSDGIIKSLDDIIEKFNELDKVSKKIKKRLSKVGDDLKTDYEFTVTENTPDGSTNGGDSTGDDPPDKSLSKAKFKNWTYQDIIDNVDTGIDNAGENKVSKTKNINEFMRGLGVNEVVDSITVDGDGSKFIFEDASTIFEQGGVDRLSLAERKRNAKSKAQDTRRILDRTKERVGPDGNIKTKPDIDLRDENPKNLGDRMVPELFNKYDIDLDSFDIEDLEKRFGKMGSAAKKLVPDMNQIYAVMAAIVPVAIVLGTQMLGVASAMGAVALAGASIIGLGLIGHADTMNASLAEAKKNLADLAEDSYDAFSGTAQLFAPIQARMFDAIPKQLGAIADSMRGLTEYEDTLFQVGAGLSKGIQKAFNAISDNEDAISQIALRFGEILGAGIIDFFGWLFEQAKNNQEMLLSLGGTLKKLATIIFRVLYVLVMFLDAFTPIIDIALLLSRVLQNRMIQALLGFTAAAYITAGAMSKLGLVALKTYSMLAGGSFINAMIGNLALITAKVSALIAEYTALNGVMATNVALGAMTVIGAGAVLAGGLAAKSMLDNTSDAGNYASDGSGFGNGGGSTYNDNRSFNINVDGSTDYAKTKRIGNEVDRKLEEDSASNKPNVTIK